MTPKMLKKDWRMGIKCVCVCVCTDCQAWWEVGGGSEKALNSFFKDLLNHLLAIPKWHK